MSSDLWMYLAVVCGGVALFALAVVRSTHHRAQQVAWEMFLGYYKQQIGEAKTHPEEVEAAVRFVYVSLPASAQKVLSLDQATRWARTLLSSAPDPN